MKVKGSMNKNETSSIAMKSKMTGRGDTVVLLPGGLAGWLGWERHVGPLSENYRVASMQLLSVDLGLRNEKVPANYSVDYETSGLSQTIEQNKITNAHFVAWSYGAEIALNFALSYPDIVRTLTLIEPPAMWVLRSRGPLAENLVKEQEKIKSFGPGDITEEQLEWFVRQVRLIPPSVNMKSLRQWPIWMRHRQSLRTQDAVYRHEDTVERLRSFRKPVLLFKGEGSTKALHQIIDILGEEFPNARVETLPGGHSPQVVAMEEFMKILTSFLRT